MHFRRSFMIFRIFHYSIHRNASDKIRVKVSLFSWGCGFKLVESIFFQMQPRPDMLLPVPCLRKIQIKTNSINVTTERWLNLVLIAFLASYGTGCYGGTIFHDWIGSPWGPKQSRWSGWSSEAAAAVARGPNHNTSTPPSTGKLDWKEKRNSAAARLHDLCTQSADWPAFFSSSGPFLRDRNHRLALALIYSSSLMAHIHTSLWSFAALWNCCQSRKLTAKRRVAACWAGGRQTAAIAMPHTQYIVLSQPFST